MVFSFTSRILSDNSDLLQIGLISTRVASWLVHSSSDIASGPGSTSVRDVVLCFGKTLYSEYLSPLKCINANLIIGDNPAME